MNVEPTARIIDETSDQLIKAAAHLDQIAKKMRERSDITYVSEALGAVSSLFSNIRLDLMATRPITSMQEEIHTMKGSVK